MDAGRHLPQVLDPGLRLRAGDVDQLPSALRIRRPLLPRELKVDERVHELLLGAVVNVSGDLLARGVAGFDHPALRRPEVMRGLEAIGDVPHEGGEPGSRRRFDASDGQLGWEQASIGAHRAQLHPAIEDPRLPRREVSPQTAAVGVP